MLDELLLRASLLVWRVAATMTGSFYPTDPQAGQALAQRLREDDEYTEEWMRRLSKEYDEEFSEWVHKDPMEL